MHTVFISELEWLFLSPARIITLGNESVTCSNRNLDVGHEAFPPAVTGWTFWIQHLSQPARCTIAHLGPFDQSDQSWPSTGPVQSLLIKQFVSAIFFTKQLYVRTIL